MAYDTKHAQDIVVSVFRSFRDDLLRVTGSVEFTKKTDNSPVTEWDEAVETKLKEALLDDDPTVGFRGEETEAVGDGSRYWIVDPIDGTTGFIRGLSYATNMAAYVVGGEVQAAVIYHFHTDDVYTAQRGEGAYKNGTPISVNTTRREGNLVAYSFTRDKFGLFQEAMNELGVRAVLPMGHAGYTYSLLAEGKIDGAINIGTRMGAYDNAPGVLLCEEAGAELLVYDDEQGVDRHEFIIGSPYLVNRIETSGLL